MVRTLPSRESIEACKRRVISEGESWTDAKEGLEFCFGHLCLYNRLNVSMSRRKEILVVVGNASVAKTNSREELCPWTSRFHQLCQREGVVLPC